MHCSISHHKPKKSFDVWFECPERRRSSADPVRQKVLSAPPIASETETSEDTDDRQTRADEGRGRVDEGEDEKR